MKAPKVVQSPIDTIYLTKDKHYKVEKCQTDKFNLICGDLKIETTVSANSRVELDEKIKKLITPTSNE
jgi:hypothetical protein